MEFTKQESQKNSIVCVNARDIQLRHTIINIPCFVSASYHCELKIDNITDINKKLLFPLICHDDANLIIIGTKKSCKFLTARQLIEIKQIGVNIESMNTKSACSSFNLLLSDLRAVGLLLL